MTITSENLVLIQRYDFRRRDDGWDESYPDQDGFWVKYEDLEALVLLSGEGEKKP
jgi:hypothetical protein